MFIGQKFMGYFIKIVYAEFWNQTPDGIHTGESNGRKEVHYIGVPHFPHLQRSVNEMTRISQS